MAIGQDWMKEVGQWQDLTFGQTKVRRQVCDSRFVDDGGMTGRIGALCIHPRIQARVVTIVNFFVVHRLMV